jgi:hypothetical protein
MYHLDRGGEAARIASSTGGAIGSEDQQAAKSLSLTEQAVTNRIGHSSSNAGQVIGAARGERRFHSGPGIHLDGGGRVVRHDDR